jgi:hypothetical protein
MKVSSYRGTRSVRGESGVPVRRCQEEFKNFCRFFINRLRKEGGKLHVMGVRRT